MTDDNYDLMKKFGRKINKEKKGYTEVDYDGIARPVLKVPSDLPKGRRRITAVYTDERQEIYRSSLARTMLIYGSKCYVHCPTIYHPETKTDITFTANLFSNNRPVPAGNSIFKYNHKTVSSEKLWVQNGYVEETHNIKPKNGYTYTCNYEGDENYKISEGEGEGVIIVFSDYRIPLTVDVLKIIMNENETGKLVARVYHRNHGEVVNIPDDVPQGGTITFYIDGEQYGKPVKISENGIATIDYKATHGVGVHLITAMYDPNTSELKEKYQKTYGANTLFIGNDTNRPVLTQKGKNCGIRGNQHVLEFTSNRKLNGKIRIYMDGTPLKAEETTTNGKISMLGNYQTCYEQEVINKSSFTYTFTIPDKRNNNSNETIWGYAGNHTMIIQYIEYNEELGDMEYWYFWEDFYIQIETNIRLDAEIDNTSYTTGKYDGNNLIYLNSNKNYEAIRPSEKTIPKSYTIGNPLRILLEDTVDGHIIKNGTVKVKITTRNMEKWGQN